MDVKIRIGKKKSKFKVDSKDPKVVMDKLKEKYPRYVPIAITPLFLIELFL